MEQADPRHGLPRWGGLASRLREWEVRRNAGVEDLCVFLCWLAIWSVQVMARYAAPGDGYLSFFADDFVYYVAPAEQLVTTGVPTFDGVVPTNGYQPLWFAVISIALFFVGGPNRLFFVLVSVITLALLGAAYVQAWRVGRTLLNSSFLATVSTYYFIVGCSWLAFDGMEVALVVFLGVSLVAHLLQHPFPAQSRSQLLRSGLLASLLTLARLDAAILLLLFLLFVGVRQRFGGRFRRGLALFALGGLLLPAYTVFSWLVFHVPLPVSGIAKHLRSSWMPTGRVVARKLIGPAVPSGWGPTLFYATYLYAYYLTVVVGSVTCLRRYRAEGRGATTPLLASVGLFPVAFLVIQSLSSDWVFWPWYYYPLFVAWPLVLPRTLVALRRWSRPVTLSASFLWLLVIPSLLLVYGGGWLSWSKSGVRQEALQIAAFMASHDGAYAMGDRAGAVRMLSKKRLVQTEGLVMDAAFVDNIRRERDLVVVLRELGVRYYVATRTTRPRDDKGGCMIFSEPSRSIAGPTSRRMTGRLCQAPVFEFHSRYGTVRIFDIEREAVGPRGH